MESISKLSDAELRKSLEANGFKAGPITETTRSLYEKKLMKLLNSKPSSTVSNSSSRGSSIGKDATKNRRRSTPVRGSVQASTTLGFSSEESESESISSLASSSLSNKQKTQRRRTLPASPLSIDLPVRPKPPNSTATNSYSSGKRSSEAHSFSKPSSSSITASSSFYEESRNKSFENIEQVLSFPGSLTRSRLPTQSGRRTNSLVDSNFEEDYSDVELSSLNRHKFNSGLNSLPSSAKPQTFSTSSFLQSLRTLPYKRSSKLNFNHSLNGSNQLRNSNYEKEFRTADDLRNATNYSQCISWLLLGFVLIFFIVLGMIYLGAKQKDANISSSLKSFSSHICKGFSTINCIEKKDLLVAVKAAHHLHEILAVAAGKFDCMDGSRRERSMNINEIKLALQNELGIEEDDADVAFANCVILVKNHPEWGVKILTKDDSTDEIRALESTSSSKSFFCRFSQAFKFVFAQALIIVIGFVLIVGGTYVGKLFYQRKKERERKLYELVEKITETLWKHHDACQKNPDMEPCIPVVHVRDTLIPPAQRSFNDWQELWNKAVKFVKENESRIRTETQRVAGEDFLVWRWLQPSAPEEFKRRGKTWQGQAFENSGSRNNALPFSPTPCLKIRNMFDPEVECEEDWPMSVRDAILEKCEGNNGIVHIHIDEPSKEGCVFMKCNSSEAAGQAYKALHGWWFDGKLVTVKYLRLERYHERFPDSKYSTTTLKPSNSLRLSLQNPQNSSSSMLEHT